MPVPTATTGLSPRPTPEPGTKASKQAGQTWTCAFAVCLSMHMWCFRWEFTLTSPAHSAGAASSAPSSGCRAASPAAAAARPAQGRDVSYGTELRHGAAAWCQPAGSGRDDSTQQGSLPPRTGDAAPSSAPSARPSSLSHLAPCSRAPNTSTKIPPYGASVQPSRSNPSSGGRRAAAHGRTGTALPLGQGGPRSPALRGGDAQPAPAAQPLLPPSLATQPVPERSG